MDENTIPQKLSISAFLFMLSYVYNRMGIMFVVLVLVSVIDYFVAVVSVIIRGEKLIWSVGIRGMLRKMITFSLVPFAILIDYAITYLGYPSHALYLGVNAWLITSEGFSVLRNAALCGVRVPKKLVRALEVYGEETFIEPKKKRRKQQ